MKKYLTVFKVSWLKILTYRVDLIMWRLRSILVLVMLYYLWHSLVGSNGRFASYSSAEVFTYVLWINFLRSAVFGVQSRQLATNINSGDISKFLAAPVNYFWYEFFRELAERSLNFILGCLEVAIFIIIVKPELYFQTNPVTLFMFMVATVLAIFIYYILSYIVGLMAFWSREAMGFRFLYEWFLEFSSGAYFPLSILSATLYTFLHFLPFMYMLFLPINLYLGKFDIQASVFLLFKQFAWICVLGLGLKFVWRSGLKKYTGEGI